MCKKMISAINELAHKVPAPAFEADGGAPGRQPDVPPVNQQARRRAVVPLSSEESEVGYGGGGSDGERGLHASEEWAARQR